MKKIYFFIILTSGIIACQNDDSSPVSDDNTAAFLTNPPAVIEFENVFKHEYGNNAEARGYYVFNDAASWQNFAQNINSPLSYNPVTGTTNNLLAVEIDFTANTVIAVVDDLYNNGGHDINVISVTESGNRIKVGVEKTYPGPGAIASVLTQPYHIVKIPKTELSVYFEEQ